MGETMGERDECQCGLDWSAHSDRDRMHCAERFGFDWRAMAAPTASHTIVALEAENARLRDWIRSHGLHIIDHTCAKCVPNGLIVLDGFECAWHLANSRKARTR